MKKLDPDEARVHLAKLPAWRHDPAAGGSITREFRFADFAQAFGFMAQVAIVAEKRDHHPDWSNVYDRVRITWTTHDAGGLSMRDVELAGLVDAVYMQRTAPAGGGPHSESRAVRAAARPPSAARWPRYFRRATSSRPAPS